MKNISVAGSAFFLCLLSSLSAFDREGLVIRDSPEEPSQVKTEKLPVIRDDRRNIRILDRDPSVPRYTLPGGGARSSRQATWSSITPVPSGSLAAELTSPDSAGRVILWSPLKQPTFLKSVRIQDVQLSPDQSVLAFVEQTGASQGPFGSRIVLLNTHSWEILKILEYTWKIDRIAFAGNRKLLAALCLRQPEMKQPRGIVFLHLDSGAMSECIRIPDSLGVDMLCDNAGRVFLSDSEKPLVCVYPSPGRKKNESVSLSVSAPSSRLALSPNGKRLAAAGGGRIDIFKTSDLRPLSPVKIPDEWPVHRILFLDNGKKFFCMPTPLSRRNSILVKVKDRVVKFLETASVSTGFGSVSPDGSKICHLSNPRGVLEILGAGDAEAIEKVSPEKIIPYTNGDPRAAYFLEASGLIAVLDESGNFYVLYRPPREKKFQKEMIFTPWTR